MSSSESWNISKEKQQNFVEALTQNLTALRAKIGISQGELANLIGVSRQTYSVIENKKKPMSWTVYLSLVLFFDYNRVTHKMIREVCAFPDLLVEQFNRREMIPQYSFLLTDENQSIDIARKIQSLDEFGINTIKTLLELEYVRSISQKQKDNK